MQISGKELTVSGKACRLCRLQDEYYEFIPSPAEFITGLKKEARADLFTFLQEVPEREPKHPFHLEWDSAAVLTLSSYEHWWKKQINDKTRNMVRKAQKTGVNIREVEFGDELVRGIQVIYNECPLRQGRAFKHYGKDFETICREHDTFLDRSQFFGAYHGDALIGFVKLVHGRQISNLMNIISMISHRDKAPTNALLAKAVEVCTGRGIPYLQYGTGNSRSIGDFKKHHAFEEFLVPRYYVPLTWKGALVLRTGFHRRLEDRIPEKWRDGLLSLRAKWNRMREPKLNRVGPPTQASESRARA